MRSRLPHVSYPKYVYITQMGHLYIFKLNYGLIWLMTHTLICFLLIFLHCLVLMTLTLVIFAQILSCAMCFLILKLLCRLIDYFSDNYTNIIDLQIQLHPLVFYPLLSSHRLQSLNHFLKICIFRGGIESYMLLFQSNLKTNRKRGCWKY